MRTVPTEPFVNTKKLVCTVSPNVISVTKQTALNPTLSSGIDTVKRQA